MKKRLTSKKIAWIATPALCLVLLSFVALPKLNHPVPKKAMEIGDTIPRAYEFDTQKLDEAMKSMDGDIKKATDQINKIDWKSVQKSIDQAVAQIDVAKIQMQAAEAVQKIDKIKLKKDIQAAINQIDVQKINEQVLRSLDAIKEIDKDKLQQDIDASLKNIDFNKMRLQLEKTKTRLEDQKRNSIIKVDQLNNQIKEKLNDTKYLLKNLNDATNEMEKDGLIDKSINNKIKFKDGTLYINGVKQSNQVSEKYKRYFNKKNQPDTSGGASVSV